MSEGTAQDPPASGKGERRLLTALVFGILLLPYATLRLPFRDALFLQAGGLAALCLAGVAVGWLRSGLAGWRPMGSGSALPSSQRLALGAYGAVAIGGSVIGWASGAAPLQIAGQLLSMLFLPLGALAGLALGGRRRWGTIVRAIAVGAGLIAAGHLVHGGWQFVQGRSAGRLILDNAVSPIGVALVALLLALASVGHLRGARRFVVLAAAVALGLFLIFSAVRGLWLLSLPAIGGFAFLAGLRGRKRRLRWTLLAALLLLTAAMALLSLGRWLDQERPNLLPSEEPGPALLAKEVGKKLRTADGAPPSVGWMPLPRPRGIGPAVEVRPERALRLRVRFRGGATGHAFVRLRFRDHEGTPIGNLGLLLPAGPDASSLVTAGTVPEGAVLARLEIGAKPATAKGRWELLSVRVEDLGPAWMAPVANQVAVLQRRLRSLTALGQGEALRRDRSVQARLTENHSALEAFTGASLPRRLFGHGLGATFEVPVEAAVLPTEVREAKAAGSTVRQSYLHNYYLFLLFKLGIVGGALVLLALGAWLAFPLLHLRRLEPGDRRSLLAAVAATWAAYLVLALSSPEILNFRLAPLWGLVIVATIGAAEGPRRSA